MSSQESCKLPEYVSASWFLYLLLDQCSAAVMTRLWAALVCLWLAVWRLLSQTQEAEWHVTDEHTHAHLQFRRVDKPEPAAAAAVAVQLNSKTHFLTAIFLMNVVRVDFAVVVIMWLCVLSVLMSGGRILYSGEWTNK